MKIYGYAQDKEILLSLEEVTLQCTLEEVENIIRFLTQAKNEHETVADKTDMCHSHLKDWENNWKKGEPDLIIFTTSK